MRSLIVIATFLTVSFSLVMADTFTASIKKLDVEGKKLTGIKGKKKGEDGTEFTMPISDKVKVVNGKFNADTKKMEAGDALEGGLKSDKLVPDAKVTITTDADNKVITEIMLGGGFGKGQGQGQGKGGFGKKKAE